MREIRSKSASEGIESDWRNVGNDIRTAIQQYENETTATAESIIIQGRSQNQSFHLTLNDSVQP